MPATHDLPKLKKATIRVQRSQPPKSPRSSNEQEPLKAGSNTRQDINAARLPPTSSCAFITWNGVPGLRFSSTSPLRPPKHEKITDPDISARP
eukprot:CAMPEP_0197681016 /NCGR_PEP_ID=MMETSP1338-20131121/94230_1 /TAXON_ID=43686 ORGANISM="Pelagodinium beii, Strain RCC1491" /NCGR_SAMPLE_ID=MMETSP1338 /ASSEMBLY_ACC=CAM_ASM_000754 /LENGTH=92 /DNA_ID=CAMNT_0043262269 /DNA_START=184 /DNA_END=458 /DNA_ORIENTATION=+